MKPNQMMIAGLVLGLVATLGCSGGGARQMLEVRPRATRLPEGSTPRLSLPKDTAFNITEKQGDHHTVGRSKVTCDAGAQPDGSAFAQAQASDGSSATSVFQIGHAVTNPTDQQIRMTLTVGYDYMFSTSADPERGFPDGKVALDLVVYRRQPRLSRDYALLSITTEDGATQSSGHDERSVSFVMDPRATYDLFLGGEVIAESKLGRSAGGELRVSNVTLELEGTLISAATGGDG